MLKKESVEMLAIVHGRVLHQYSKHKHMWPSWRREWFLLLYVCGLVVCNPTRPIPPPTVLDWNKVTDEKLTSATEPSVKTALVKQRPHFSFLIILGQRGKGGIFLKEHFIYNLIKF